MHNTCYHGGARDGKILKVCNKTKYNDLYVWCRNEGSTMEKIDGDEKGWNMTKELIRICKLLTDQNPTIDYQNWYIIGIDKPEKTL